MTNHLTYWLDITGKTHPVREIRGEERLSTPFRLEARFVVQAAELLEVGNVVRQPACVRLERDACIRTITGIVTDVSVGASKRASHEILVVVEPELVLARYRVDMRVFREKAVPEIVGEVLEGIGIRHQWRLSQAYGRRHYCVQFRESDFDFIHRLLEDEGIFYFFLDDGTMVLADLASAYEPICGASTLFFRPGTGMDHDGDAIISMGMRATMTVGKVSLGDFNPEKPSLDMSASAETGTGSDVEWYDYPGEYQDPGVGARKAALHAEAFACAASGFYGRSFSARLFPGSRFTLSLSPIGIADGDYAILAVRHEWAKHADGFVVDFEAYDADVAYRPPRKTPAPQMLNPITGFVTGPPGEDIHTDAWGRVKVHFHWDRVQPLDDNCSYWIPVLQDNTGQSCGIPRVGWEVLVHFLEGDPDRPVVLGRVYNAADEFPEVLPSAKTRSALKSMSSPGRVGTNHIRFDDLAGEQEINIHAERDKNVVVVHDKTERVELREFRLVKRDDSVAIGNDHTENIGAHHALSVGGNQTITVGASRERKVGIADAENVTGNRSLFVGVSHRHLLGETLSVGAEMLKEKVGALILETSLKDNGTQAELAASLTVGGAIAEIAKAEKSESANAARIETVGGLLFSKSKEDMATRVEGRRTTTIGGMMKANAKKQLTIVGVEKLSKKAANAAFKASTQLTLKVGETSVSMKDGLLTIHAPSRIVIKITGLGKLGANRSTQI